MTTAVKIVDWLQRKHMNTTWSTQTLSISSTRRIRLSHTLQGIQMMLLPIVVMRGDIFKQRVASKSKTTHRHILAI